MITAYFRSVSAALLVLSLSGCQLPGFASMFGKKEDPAVADRLAARGSQSGGDQAAWNANRFGAPLANRGVEEELRIARRAREEGQLIPARMSFEKVLQMQPQNVEAHQGMAVICDQIGSFREAEVHYRQALERAPNDAGLHSNLGYSYYLQGRSAEAARELQLALQYDPNHRTAMYNLGLVRGMQGNLDQAMVLFRQSGVSEGEARGALAQFAPAGGHGLSQEAGPQIAGGNPGSPGAGPDLASMNPETRKLWESIQKEKAAQAQLQSSVQGKRLQDQRLAAPHPGGRNVPGRNVGYAPPAGEDQRQQALKYLQDGRPNPAELARAFSRIDQAGEQELSIAQASSLRSESRYIPATSVSQQQPPGGYGAPGTAAPGSLASPQEFSWTTPATQQPTGITSDPAAPSGAWGQPSNPQSASGGIPEWNQLSTNNPGHWPPQSGTASRQYSGTISAPRITSKNSGVRSPGVSAMPSNLPTVHGGVPLWNSAAEQPQSSMQNWSENSLPGSSPGAPNGSSSGDDFVPIPGQEGNMAPWSNGVNHSSAQPLNRSGVIQASATMPAASPHSTGTAPPNTYEQARLTAAQMGLHAGSGAPFPPGESENSIPHAMGSQPTTNQMGYPESQHSTQDSTSNVVLSPHHPVPGAGIPSAQGMVFGSNAQEMLPTNNLSHPGIPRAAIPSGQSFTYGQTSQNPAQEQLLKSVANETLRQRLQQEQQLQQLRQGAQNQLPQWQANQRTTSPGNAYPAYRPGPRALTTGAELPDNGGFPGQ